MSETLSSTMQDYLVQTYRLSDEFGEQKYVGTSELADELLVSPPAVNRMVTKLKELGYLEHERYQGIRLTDAGRLEALKALRRHRIAEVFLVKIMGFAWHEIYEEAKQMSMGLGDPLLERMIAMTDNPTVCPHGSPIPLADGSVTAIDDFPLAGAEAEQSYTITRVTIRESDRLEYLAALGLTPQTTLQLIHAAPFNGPMQLQLGQEYRIVGHNLAEVIRVRPAT